MSPQSSTPASNTPFPAPPSADKTSAAFQRLIQTVHRLRAPGGCPWDREQTHQSLRPYLIEEAYEALAVLDLIHSPDSLKNERIRGALREELGDVLLQVVLHSQLTSEAGAFDAADVADALSSKLVHRHPHVFGDTAVSGSDEVLKNWEAIKAAEKKNKAEDTSVLSGLPAGLPALQRAGRVLEKVTKVGFQWNDLEGPWKKLEEEISELKELVDQVRLLPSATQQKEARNRLASKITHELGDVLFCVANLAFCLGVTPEDALRSNLRRFEKRFRYVENRLASQGKTPQNSTLDQMDIHWNEAKLRERLFVIGLTGGIAAGKSAVATHWKKQGIAVIDADQMAREVMAPGTVGEQQVLEALGTTQRAELRRLIFGDPQKRAKLESILHPLIGTASENKFLELAAKSTTEKRIPVVYEASLLVETGRYRELDALITIEAPELDRIERVKTRDGVDLEQARAIVQAQAPESARRAVATRVIENSGTINSLLQVADAVFSEIVDESFKPFR